MNGRVILIISVIVLMIAGYIILSQNEIEKNMKENQLEVPKDILMIVSDLRGLEGKSRTNVLQCQVDIAGSKALVGVKKGFMALEDGKCAASINGEGFESTDEICLNESKKAYAVIYISKSENKDKKLNGKNIAYVEVGENYTKEECANKINVKKETG